jgi:hypothetical protein
LKAQNFGLRWQSAAPTPLSHARRATKIINLPTFESGVALRFPPHSKIFRDPSLTFRKRPAAHFQSIVYLNVN